jgi:hypothetical protein
MNNRQQTISPRRRGCYGIELIVVVTIILGLLAVFWSLLRGRAERSIVSVLVMRTSEHEGHLWVIGGQGQWGVHHPDCPCRRRIAESEGQP